MILKPGILGLAIAALGVAFAAQATAAETSAVGKVVEGNNRFACKLHGKLREQPGNLFYSPYSISTALGMTYAGARGATATQMATALDFGPNDPAFHAAMGQLIRDFNAAGKQGAFKLSVANALWAQHDYTFLPAYTQLVTTNYEAAVRNLNFQKETEAARQTINRWVEDKTNDKIKELLKPGVLDSDTRLVLTNAIYFKSAWLHPFTKEATSPGPFTRLDGQKADVPMMHQTERLAYVKADGMQAVELPYEGSALSMVILLPEKVDGLTDLEQGLTADKLTAWRGKMNRFPVELTLPKFKMTSEFALKGVLSSLGMVDAFTTAADFSGMDGSKSLSIQHVIHKAFVDVNEDGTEAAAATAVAVAVTSAPIEPQNPIVVKVDHPFLFAIRENKTGSILFIGRVVTP
ncbi:MAG: serpin family protein [Planctomycetes bacterium]|nr:serpin family protein [Planctomycetota bacterium]